jgi:hypothetical protein
MNSVCVHRKTVQRTDQFKLRNVYTASFAGVNSITGAKRYVLTQSVAGKPPKSTEKPTDRPQRFIFLSSPRLNYYPHENHSASIIGCRYRSVSMSNTHSCRLLPWLPFQNGQKGQFSPTG